MRSGLMLMTIGLFLAAPALAGKPPPANQAEKRAATLIEQAQHQYLKREYRDAAKLWKKALRLSPDPRLIYNVARAYEKDGDLTSSWEHYRAYLASSETEPGLVAKANAAMEKMEPAIQAKLAAQQTKREEQAKAQREADAEKKRAAEAAAATERIELERRIQRELEAEHDRARSKATKVTIASASVAGVGLVSGAIFSALAGSARQSALNASDADLRRGFERQTRMNGTVADVSFGVAVAAAITAVVAYPRETEEPKKEVRFAVTPASTGAGVAVSY